MNAFHQFNIDKFRNVVIIGAALTLSACASKQHDNPLVLETKQHFDKVAGHDYVKSKAPIAYQQAEDKLKSLEDKVASGAEEKEVEYLAYVSQRKSSVAQQQAELNIAEEKVSQAEVARKDILIALKSQEAEQAKQLAGRMADQAIDARRELDKTRQEKKQMQLLLAEFKAKETERGLVLTLDDILFDLNKAELKPGSERAVNKIADFLKEYPERKVLVEGFTDSTGEEDYNEQLSFKRAEAIRTVLQAHGVAGDRVKVEGYGEKFPVASNSTSAGRQMNRRVEIIIADKGDNVTARK